MTSRLRWARVLIVVGVGAVGIGACDVDDAEGTTSAAAVIDVQVEMRDHTFTPAAYTFTLGSVVVFHFRNLGLVRHEAVVGDDIFQQGHVDHQHMGNMQMVNAVLVEPGQQADLAYRFDVAGTILIGCHEPGHWEAGMLGIITVQP